MAERISRKKGILRELMNGHHVDHGRELTRVSWVNHIEVGDVTAFDMVGEEVVDGVLIRRSTPSNQKG